MLASLFRAEAINNQQQRLFGEISLAQPVSLYMLSLLFALFLLVLMAFLLSTEHHRKERVRGFLVPSKGLIQVLAPQAGIVEEVFAREGTLVEMGDPLVSLVRHSDAGNKGLESVHREQLEQRISLNAQSLTDNQSLLAAELRSNASLQRELKDKLRNLEIQNRLLATRIELHRKQIEAAKALSLAGHVADFELDRLEAQLLEYQQQSAQLEQQLMAVHQDQRLAVAQGEQLPLQYALTTKQLKRTQSELKQQLAEVHASYRSLVQARRTGRVTAVQISIGESLSLNSPILSFVPEGSNLLADLYLPTRSAGLVNVGHKAKLRFDAFPYQRFGMVDAEILQIDKSLQVSNRTNAYAANEPVYRVRTHLSKQHLELHQNKFALRAGMQVEADILLEKRRLFDWVLEPLIGLRARLNE